jgi:hypothetical protein
MSMPEDNIQHAVFMSGLPRDNLFLWGRQEEGEIMIGLDPFQEEVLEAFFAREDGFFLTGGAALAGYHIHHRATESLELCTVEDRVRVGESALLEAASEIGSKIQRLEAPEAYGKFLLRRGDDSLVVNIAQDLSPQVQPEKTIIGEIRVDRPKEITARLLCALRSHFGLGDLVDLRALEIAGHTVEDHLEAAAYRNPEVTPAALVRSLSEFEIGEDERPPGEISAADLRSYVAVLILRLTSLAART